MEVHGVVVEALEDREGQEALRLAAHVELRLLRGRLVVAGDLVLCLVVELLVCLNLVENVLPVCCLIRLLRPLRRQLEAVCGLLGVGCLYFGLLEASRWLQRDDGPDQMLGTLHLLPISLSHVDVLVLLARDRLIVAAQSVLSVVVLVFVQVVEVLPLVLVPRPH